MFKRVGGVQVLPSLVDRETRISWSQPAPQTLFQDRQTTTQIPRPSVAMSGRSSSLVSVMPLQLRRLGGVQVVCAEPVSQMTSITQRQDHIVDGSLNRRCSERTATFAMLSNLLFALLEPLERHLLHGSGRARRERVISDCSKDCCQLAHLTYFAWV